jgi:hypothetical protein
MFAKLIQSASIRSRHFASAGLIAFFAMAFGPLSLHLPGRTPAESVPVHMVVTVEAHHGTEVPDIRPQDVTVRQGNERAQVTDFIQLRDDRARLELFVLVDDALLPTSLGPQLRRFIASQPDSTMIGVAYMRGERH